MRRHSAEQIDVHNDIAKKLWNLCDVLRDDETNDSGHVTELMLLLEAPALEDENDEDSPNA